MVAGLGRAEAGTPSGAVRAREFGDPSAGLVLLPAPTLALVEVHCAIGTLGFWWGSPHLLVLCFALVAAQRYSGELFRQRDILRLGSPAREILGKLAVSVLNPMNWRVRSNEAPRRLICYGWVLALGLVACQGSPSGQGPEEASSAVHERGGYPDDFEVESPKWVPPSLESSVDSKGSPREVKAKLSGEAPRVSSGAEPVSAGPPSAGPSGEAPSASEPRRTEVEGGRGHPVPSQQKPTNSRAPERREDGRDAEPRATPQGASPSATPDGLPSLSILLLVLALVFAALLLGWAVVRLLERRAQPVPIPSPLKPPTPGVAAMAAATSEDSLDPSLGDPEQWANRGQYREALRALLVQSLLMTGWTPDGAGCSCTAREVLSHLAPSDPRRAPLQAVIGGVEAVRFGGREATAELFSLMRLRFQELLQTHAIKSEDPIS